ncbi:MAG TPA: glycosyltransferase [Phycisphaerales bacterium]|nr:glycosyltransferase [Phycisphaerales bacterium]
MPPSATGIELSLLAPAHNEQDNIDRLVAEAGAALEAAVGPGRYEFVIVDDGSTDQTRPRVTALMPARPWLRCIAMAQTPPGKGNGQSAAFYAGVRACRGRLIATIDADLQNDPADLKGMLDLMARENADLVQGDRSHARADNAIRKFTSWVGRVFRGLILADAVRDTGCSLRVMKAEIALQLPLQFKGMHRFIPVTAVQLGYKVVETPVHHRARVAGETKYGFGIWQRALPGLIDCFAVRWMSARRRPTASVCVSAAGATQ